MLSSDGEDAVMENISCSTVIKKVCIHYKWTISNFNLCYKDVDQSFKSSVFWAEEEKHIRWQLEFFPCGFKRQITNTHGQIQRGPPPILISYALLKLRLVASNECQFPVSYTITLNQKKGPLVLSNAKKEFSKGDIVSIDTKHKMEDFVKEQNGFLINNNLTISCQLIVTCTSVQESYDMESIRNKDLEFSVLKKLLESREFSDAILVVEGKEIPVHKAILATRSPVFAAMFKHDMQEKQDSRVEIVEISYETASEMIHYVYTGTTTDNFRKNTTDLFVAADKYGLQGLKLLCEKVLNRDLTVETASDVLVLADLYNLQSLKQKVIDFINEHSEAVTRTEGWNTIAQKHPHVLIAAFLFKHHILKPENV